MAKANDFFNPRLDASHYVAGSRWEYATVAPPDQRWEHHDALDGRAAWFYEAVTNDIAMHGQETGWGQVYLSSYQDRDGDWLDGGVNYVLHLPPDVPAETFWSMTLYDVDTRCIIKNEQQISDRSSRMALLENSDGSIDLYFGPDAPANKEQNWIPTRPFWKKPGCCPILRKHKYGRGSQSPKVLAASKSQSCAAYGWSNITMTTVTLETFAPLLRYRMIHGGCLKEHLFSQMHLPDGRRRIRDDK